MVFNINFDELSSRLFDCKTPGDLKNCMHSFFVENGVLYYNFLYIEYDYGKNENIAKSHNNYPQHWIQQKLLHNYEDVDPAMFMAQTTNCLSTWNNAFDIVSKEVRMSKLRRELLKRMDGNVSASELQNSIIVPLVGPNFKQHIFHLIFHQHIDIAKKMLQTQFLNACFMLNNAHVDIHGIQPNKGDPSTLTFEKYARYPFTERETTILKLICNGKARDDIAFMTKLSIRTVDSLIKKIYGRIRVHNTTQLFVVVHYRGWWRLFSKN